jgi:hypothetical protein
MPVRAFTTLVTSRQMRRDHLELLATHVGKSVLALERHNAHHHPIGNEPNGKRPAMAALLTLEVQQKIHLRPALAATAA